MLGLKFPPINELIRWRDIFENFNKVGLIAVLAALIGILVFLIAGSKDPLKAPTGVRNLAETGVNFIENDIVMQTMGKDGLRWTEIYSAPALGRHIAALEGRGFQAAHLLGNEEPILQLQDADGRRLPTRGLLELLDAVRNLGRRGLVIQRYKGLGEMNPEQLWETTMNPERRTMLKVTLEDAVEADRIFTILMGDQVDPRRQFIESHARFVKNLDV